jgi:hypothetical protein
VSSDPVHTDPSLYRVVFENERVRVLEYRDVPGVRTHPHAHPDSVMQARALGCGVAAARGVWFDGIRSRGTDLRGADQRGDRYVCTLHPGMDGTLRLEP